MDTINQMNHQQYFLWRLKDCVQIIVYMCVYIYIIVCIYIYIYVCVCVCRVIVCVQCVTVCVCVKLLTTWTCRITPPHTKKESNVNFVFIYGFIFYTITENRGTPTCLNLTSQREREKREEENVFSWTIHNHRHQPTNLAHKTAQESIAQKKHQKSVSRWEQNATRVEKKRGNVRSGAREEKYWNSRMEERKCKKSGSTENAGERKRHKCGSMTRGNARSVEVDARKCQNCGSRWGNFGSVEVEEKMSEVWKWKKCVKTRDRNAT